jgi:hypothetical protein
MGDLPSARLSYLSDMSFSSVSVDIDLLQERNAATNVSTVDSGVESLILSKSVKQLARHSSQALPKSMMPIISHEQQGGEYTKSGSTSDTRMPSPSYPKKQKYKQPSTPTKRLKLKERASGFFSKLLPQSNIGTANNETEIGHSGRYSFVPGDDKAPSETMAPAATGRSISRSLSLSSLLQSSREQRSHRPEPSPLSSTPKSVPEEGALSRENEKSSSTQLCEDSEASPLTVVDGGSNRDDRKHALCGRTLTSSSA